MNSCIIGKVAAALKPGVLLLLAEPAGHVKPLKFRHELEAAQSAGFEVTEHPVIRRSRVAVLRKREQIWPDSQGKGSREKSQDMLLAVKHIDNK